MPLDIRPISQTWSHFEQALRAREAFVPAPTPNGLTAFSCPGPEGYFMAGALFFPADRLIIAEFLVTNPDIPMWERHRAVVELGKSFLLHAAASGKSPWIMVRHRGVARALERAGYRTGGAVLYEA